MKKKGEGMKKERQGESLGSGDEREERGREESGRGRTPLALFRLACGLVGLARGDGREAGNQKRIAIE